MIWLVVGALALALFACVAPSMGVLGGLAVVGGCLVAASGVAVPLILYMVWQDSR